MLEAKIIIQNGRASKGTCQIVTKKHNKGNYLVVKNAQITKSLQINNLLRVHTRWLNKGKLTLVFHGEKPVPVQVMLENSKSTLLHGFLQKIKLAGNNVQIKDPEPVNPPRIESMKLVTVEKFHKVFKDNSTFPKTLKSLHIQGFTSKIMMKKFLTFANHENLKVLSLKNVQLQAFPKVFETCAIQDLDLSENQIEQFEFNQSKLADSLLYLDVSSNKIKKIPPSILFLQKLQKLSMAKNKVKVLPAFISDLPALEKLHLQNNLIRCFSSQALNLGSNLKSSYQRKFKELDLSGNFCFENHSSIVIGCS